MSGEPTRIGYLTDDPAADYNRGLDDAATPTELRAFLKGWPNLAPDALAAARSIKSPDDWADWRVGLAKERGGTFAGMPWAERFAAILMPGRMLRASMTADQFAVPWGLAWLRLKEAGMLDGGESA